MGEGRPGVGEEGGVADIPVVSGTRGRVGDVLPVEATSTAGVVASIGSFSLRRRTFRHLRRLAPLFSRFTEAGTMEVGRGQVVLGGQGD